MLKIIGNTFEEFLCMTEGRPVIAFGASEFLKLMSINFEELNLGEKIHFIVDNSEEKTGTDFEVCGKKKKVLSPGVLADCQYGNAVVLIASDTYAYEMYCQLDEDSACACTDCFILSLMIGKHHEERVAVPPRLASESRIPKKIHFFWFSKSEKDDATQKCLDSWKKFCPDYEIIEWNTDNYDVSKNRYMRQAIENKKWAFASDYARFDVVYRHGGIYMDTDVELFRSLDSFLSHNFFTGFGPIRDVEGAVFGAVPGLALLRGVLDAYQDREFQPENYTSLFELQPVFLDDYFRKKGFIINGCFQEKDGAAIYPREIFSARNWFTGEIEADERAYGIHYCAGGWSGKNELKIRRAEGNRRLQDLYLRGQVGK